MIDCHCHLLDVPGLSEEFLQAISRRHINKIYCNSVAAQQWSALTTLAAAHQQIIPFYGLHPWHIASKTVDSDLARLATVLQDDHCLCGEIGLDRLCDTDFTLQEDVFIRQLDLAMATDSFIAIHCVKAWGRLLEILQGYRGRIAFMIHGFQGSKEVMERLVAMGGMISFSDRVMTASPSKGREVLRATPLENLLLETDFPFQKSGQGVSAQTYCQILENLYAYAAQAQHITVAELTKIIERNGTFCTY